MGNSVRRINPIKKGRSGQSTLETAVVFIIIFLFIGGIIRIWFWGNAQIVKRQANYNASRVPAGTSSDKYTLRWPVYAPDNLTEEEVLTGGTGQK